LDTQVVSLIPRLHGSDLIKIVGYVYTYKKVI
jgi:hypothetical protein